MHGEAVVLVLILATVLLSTIKTEPSWKRKK